MIKLKFTIVCLFFFQISQAQLNRGDVGSRMNVWLMNTSEQGMNVSILDTLDGFRWYCQNGNICIRGVHSAIMHYKMKDIAVSIGVSFDTVAQKYSVNYFTLDYLELPIMFPGWSLRAFMGTSKITEGFDYEFLEGEMIKLSVKTLISRIIATKSEKRCTEIMADAELPEDCFIAFDQQIPIDLTFHVKFDTDTIKDCTGLNTQPPCGKPYRNMNRRAPRIN